MRNELQQYDVSTSAMIFDPNMLSQMQAMATVMSQSKITVPKHLQGQSGDCLAIVMQAAQWRMNPFVVAQKTHVVNGTLGYEAQLVNAVVQQSGVIDGRFHYEYKGDLTSLECRVGAIIKGEIEITWGEWLCIATVTTKNSPLWKTNPKQQMGYLQVKNWARLYTPGALLGVYSVDELQPGEPVEKEINPIKDQKTADVLGKLNKKQSPIEPQQEASLNEVMAAISNMHDKPSREFATGLVMQLTGNNKDIAAQAFKDRMAELKRESDAIKFADFEAAIGGSSNIDELNTIISGMPDEAYSALKELIDSKADALDNQEAA